MHDGTKARRRRNRITEMNFERHDAFEKPGESHLEYDCCEHGNEAINVVRRTFTVTLPLLLISFTGNKLYSTILTK